MITVGDFMLRGISMRGIGRWMLGTVEIVKVIMNMGRIIRPMSTSITMGIGTLKAMTRITMRVR